MYDFVDINEVSECAGLPSEALKINGEYIENLIAGYRTLQVTGREALSAELSAYETGNRDGSVLQGKRYPARYITVKYQLLADSPAAFRTAYNKLASILNVKEAELIFEDEPDKFFIGTPEEIGEVPGGANSVVGEFTLYCADPFKYSVTEYEAEPDLIENGFLIDYKGTYKAFPILEAEFYNENESEAALTGNGDCGYVAFFNEKEKIIQLGDPDEVDTEDYAKSQTLVSQHFEKETAWNALAQNNWATNNAINFFAQMGQTGNFAMAVASYLTTIAPPTTGTLLTKRSTAQTPYIDYKVSAETYERTENSINVKVTVAASLVGGSGSGKVNIVKGAKVTLKNTNIYASSTASSSSGKRSGTYYLWDGSVVKNRIRITNASNRVGVSGQVTGWVNVADLGLSGASGGSIDAKYGLKGAIQFNNGDWHYVTIKNEGANWGSNATRTVTLVVKVKGLEADTTLLENIRFKVTRTDNEDGKAGILDETTCSDFEISTYTAPVPYTWYLKPETFGTGTGWHGPSITRTLPADAAGEVGAKNFTFSYRHQLSIGSGSTATQELGAFMVFLVCGSGANRKIVAGVDIYKGASGKAGTVCFYVNGKKVEQVNNVDFSLYNDCFGVVRTSSITKTGKQIQFNVGTIKKTYNDSSVENLAVTEITFHLAQYGTKPALSYNGLYWAKFVKNNCDTWNDIPNKFSTNDIVKADCKNGEVYLNNALTPSLGALGNDWEDFYLSPGLNQIGFSYSDWVDAAYAPKFKIRYREVFI